MILLANYQYFDVAHVRSVNALPKQACKVKNGCVHSSSFAGIRHCAGGENPNRGPANLQIAQASTWIDTSQTSTMVSQTKSLDELNTEQQDADAEPIYKYVGNSFSFKFHRPSCRFANAMWKKHRLFFQFRKQAIDAGQKPCRYCLPPEWKSVDAKLLNPRKPDSNQPNAESRLQEREDRDKSSQQQFTNDTTFSDTGKTNTEVKKYDVK